VKFGSLRRPGADLTRLPVGLDLHTISIAEGIRAAFACGILILANEWLAWPPLVYMALAANLACFCDLGGPIRPRLATLLSFSLLGALSWGGFGLLGGAGLPVMLPVAAFAFFCSAFVRVWGQSAQTVGNLLSVVLVLAVDHPLTLKQAGVAGAMFTAGGLWAVVLTLILWRLHQYRPAREAVAEVWRDLAMLTGDLRRLAAREAVETAEWDDHARAHRRALRIAIEHARGLVMELVSARGAMSPRGSQALLRLEAGDQLFGALIALAELLDEAPPSRRQALFRLLRLLQPLLLNLARLIAEDAPADKERMREVIDRLAAAAGDPALEPPVAAIAHRLRIAVRLSTPEGYSAGSGLADAESAGWRERLLTPLRANLDWNSAMFRHALRTVAIAAPALAIASAWHGSFARWLPITVVLTIQPFYATTWQRALERTGGTVLGGFIGAGLALLASTPLALAALLFPLSVIGFAARQVSYEAYVACLTPQLVVLVELLDPGHSSWEIAGMRALFTVLGGVVSVTGALLLWPIWEPARLRQELAGTTAAYGRYIHAVLSEVLGEASAEMAEAARRGAGLASNNLEVALTRALQEPVRRHRPRLEAAMAAASTLRRLAGPVSILHHGAQTLPAAELGFWQGWRDWAAEAFAALEREERPPSPPPGEAPDPLARLAAQIELLDGALGRFWQEV
jgi:uncharacterized membrane protein YccC